MPSAPSLFNLGYRLSTSRAVSHITYSCIHVPSLFIHIPTIPLFRLSKNKYLHRTTQNLSSHHLHLVTAPDSRARGLVRQRGLVDVDEDTSIVGAVGARELDGRGRGGAAAAGDGDLVAAHVELSTALATCAVQGQRLGADEVVARRERLGDYL